MPLNAFTVDPQRQQLCARGNDGGFDACARIRINHQGDAPAAPGAAHFSSKRALTARRGNYLVDLGRRNGAQVAPAEVPFVADQAANFIPFASLEGRAHAARDGRNFFQTLPNTAVSVDVPLEYFPVVDAVLPWFSCVAEDQPALEFVDIAAERFAAFAPRCKHNRGGPAERRRVMVLGSRWHLNDDGLDVAADVDPVFALQSRAGQPGQGGADGH